MKNDNQHRNPQGADSAQSSPIPEDDRRSRILAYLNEHDTPCPGCGYNLRSASVLICPECGGSFKNLDIDHLQTLFFDIRFEKRIILIAIVLLTIWLLLITLGLILTVLLTDITASILIIPSGFLVLLAGFILLLWRAKKNTARRLLGLPTYIGSSWVGGVCMVIIIAAGMPLALVIISLFG